MKIYEEARSDMEPKYKKTQIPFLAAFEDTFYKSAVKDIVDNFTSKHVFKKWLLFSDYYFETDKPNNAISFSFIPYNEYLDIKEKTIKSVAPKDIKHSRTVNKNFISYLKNEPILNINFVISNPNKYFLGRDRNTFLSNCNNTVEVLKEAVANWENSYPEDKEYYKKLKMKIQCLATHIKNDKKLKYINQMFIVTVLGGYLCAFINKQIDIDVLGWFSDRDPINDVCDGLSLDLFDINFIQLGKKDTCKFIGAKANSSSDEWYKELTRICDYIVGTLADYDMLNNSITKLKFDQMLTGFFSNNKVNNFVFKLDFDNRGEVQCSRLSFNKLSSV